MTESSPSAVIDPTTRRDLLERRVLVLDGVLDNDNGALLMTSLLTMSADDPVTDIQFWIHSPGGSVPAMLAIRDLMQSIPNDVSTLVLGIACSAGQFLLSAGTPGKRRALAHSRVLLHQGSAGIGGTAVDIALQADALRSTRDTVLGLIAQDTGQAIGTVFEDSLHDHWYSATEALEYGFIDAILTSSAEIGPMARSSRPPIGFTGIGVEVGR